MFKRFKQLFAAKPEGEAGVSAPGTTGKVPVGDVGWSESLLYRNSTWDKYNPDDLMPRKGHKVYQRMMQDEQVKAVVRFKRDAIASRAFYFECPEEYLPSEEELVPPDGEAPAEGEAPTPPDGTPPTQQKPPQMARFAAPAPAPSNVKPFPPKAKQPDTNPAKAPSTDTPPPPDTNEAPGELPPDPAVAAAEAKREELELREKVLEKAFTRMRGSFTDGLHAILSAMHNGFSMTEKVYEQFEYEGATYIGLKALRARPFESFYFNVDEYGNIKKVVQRWDGEEQDIDYERFVHYVQNPDVDPHYGQSELRAAYRAWWSKDVTIKMFNIHIERHASGFLWAAPDAKDGPTLVAGTAEFTALQNALTSMATGNALIAPKGVTINYETPATTDAFEKAIAIHDKAIAKALLVPNLLGISEQGNTGSYSQSQTQLEAFLWTLDADARRLEEAINEQIVKDLGDKNWGDGEYPRFCFKPISDTVRQNILRLWNEMVKAGTVQSTDTDEAHVREMLDFPEAGEPIKKPTPPMVLPGLMPSPQPPGTNQDEKPKAPGKAQPPDETIIGKGQLKVPYSVVKSALRRVDFSVIDTKTAKLSAAGAERVREAIRDGVQQMTDWLKEQDIHANPDLAADAALTGRVVARIRKAFNATLNDAWALGQQHALTELGKARGTRFIAKSYMDEVAQKYIDAQAYRLAGDVADNVRKKAQTILFNGVKGDWPLEEIISRIDDEIGATAEPWSATSVRTSVFDAVNEARYAQFTDPELGGYVEALMYSAVLDETTTEFCEYMDGRVYAKDSPVWDTHYPPNHFNCRSVVVAVTQDDRWQEDDPPAMDPEDGFGG